MTRVLVVDDSSFMRRSVAQLLTSDNSIEVVGTAADGEEAVRLVRRLDPDVVILDIKMPKMDGLLALTHIMSERPTPILVLTGLGQTDGNMAIKCLQKGAVDIIAKPSGVISYDIAKLKHELIAKVKLAAGLNARALCTRAERRAASAERTNQPASNERIVVMGASTGGPRAVSSVLPALAGQQLPPLLIVQHMAAEFVPYFADRLGRLCALHVCVACEGQPLHPKCILVAPGGRHTLVVRELSEYRVRLSDLASPCTPFPCVDYAMASAAEAYGPGTIGVLLTGTGSDGARGMQAIKNAGGSTAAQDPATCLAPGMPQAAIAAGCADYIVPLPRMAETIARLL